MSNNRRETKETRILMRVLDIKYTEALRLIRESCALGHNLELSKLTDDEIRKAFESPNS